MLLCLAYNETSVPWSETRNRWSKQSSVADGYLHCHCALRGVWFSRFFNTFPIEYLDTCSVKHRLITKLIVQIEINLRDESIKPN
jgi:hypothetical protein